MNQRVIRRRSVPALAQPLHSLPLLARIYAARGVTAPEQLETTLERLIPVSALTGVDAAVALLLKHRERASRIMVIGDFDTDGATSTALVVRQLRRLGFAHVDFLVPNRFQFGYGLTAEIVMLAFERRPDLIITVDNGIASHAGVAAANALGMEVLITDHHLAASTLPRAAAIVNPNAPGNQFPSKALAGVGVAFYVMAAVTRQLVQQGVYAAQAVQMADWLDLVALGTVADVVPLDTNNRILVAQGLRRIRAGRCVPGIRALLECANKRVAQCSAAELGFQLGPRLNAAGRLDDMTLGIQCLLTDDAQAAQVMAAQLNQLNLDRRDIEQQMQSEALAGLAEREFDADTLPLGLCLYEEQWHQGVVGLVASRIKERLHRPVIAMAKADAITLKGSARSVPGVHIRDVLDAVAVRHPGLIDKFGGHAMAAGLSIELAKLDAFRAAFDAEVRRWMTLDDAVGVVLTDGELQADEFALSVAQTLRESGPWGQQFSEPLFDGLFDIVDARVVGERHLKLKVRALSASESARHDSGEALDAIVFRYFDDESVSMPSAGDCVRLAYRLDINEFRGEEKLQLIVEYLQPE